MTLEHHSSSQTNKQTNKTTHAVLNMHSRSRYLIKTNPVEGLLTLGLTTELVRNLPLKSKRVTYAASNIDIVFVCADR